MDKSWKDDAKALYSSGVNITEIAARLNKSRKTVSKYINSLNNLTDIKKTRTEIKIDDRKEQKRAWKQNHGEVEKAQLVRQHNIDVAVLSREKIYN